jgi:hypothetical protein
MAINVQPNYNTVLPVAVAGMPASMRGTQIRRSSKPLPG